MSKEETKINRRNFLRTSSIASLGVAFCLSGGMKEALALSKLVGKPVLTEPNINRLLQRESAERNMKKVISEIVADPVKWLDENFAITKTQLNAIKSISSADWKKIESILRPSIKNDGLLQIKLIQFSTPSSLSMATSFNSGLGKCKGKAKATYTTKDEDGNKAEVTAEASYET